MFRKAAFLAYRENVVCFMGWLVSAFVKRALYGNRLVSLFTGRGGGIFCKSR